MPAESRDVLHGAQCDELAGDVADRGAFEGEADHGQACGVDGGLAKQAGVAGTGRTANF